MSIKSIFELWCPIAWFEEEECHLNIRASNLKIKKRDCLKRVYQKKKDAESLTFTAVISSQFSI